MMSDEVTYVIRLVNLALALIAFIWMALKASSHWSAYGSAMKAYAIAFLSFSLSVLYGTAEALVLEVEGGARLLLATFAMCCMLYALWVTRGRSVAGEEGDS